jgi:hypothetical protein
VTEADRVRSFTFLKLFRRHQTTVSRRPWVFALRQHGYRPQDDAHDVALPARTGLAEDAMEVAAGGLRRDAETAGRSFQAQAGDEEARERGLGVGESEEMS